MPLPESAMRPPLSEPMEYPHKDGVYLDAEVVRQYIAPVELDRKVSCMSAELVADIIKETDEECERLTG